MEDAEVDAPYDTDPDWSLATAAIPNTVFRPATAARLWRYWREIWTAE